jgi:hypothetical protein
MEAYFSRMIGIFGSVDALAKDFVGKKTVEKILAMPEGIGKNESKVGAEAILSEMKNRVTDNTLKQLIDIELGKLRGLPATAAGGKRRFKMPRKMTRKYCKKTPCKKMGFTQRASCRPWKNCYKNKK